MNEPSDDLLRQYILELGFHPELISADFVEAVVDALNRVPHADLDERKRRILRAVRQQINASAAESSDQSDSTIGETATTASEAVQLPPSPPQPRHESFEPSIALGGHGDETDADETTEWVVRLAPTDERIEYRQGTSQQLAGDLYIRLTWMPDDSLVEFSLSGSFGVGRHVSRSIAYASSVEALESGVPFSPDTPEVTTWTSEIDKPRAPRTGDLLRVDYADTKTGLAIVIRTTLE